jgi:signal transduction histidine kinase
MRQEKDPVKLQHLFDMQAEHIKKMDTFIQDIVTLSKNTRIDLDVQEIDLEKVFFEIIDQFRFLQGAAQMKFEYDCTGLPTLHSDAFRVQLVLGNLISNAVRYHDPAKAQPSLRLQAHIELDKAILKLQDNGIGIDPSHVGRIFEMFYRASKNSKGSGIGLYITQETLQKIGGTIRVESEPGVGSTFIVELPNHAS